MIKVANKKVYSIKGKKGDQYFLHCINTPRYYFAKKAGKAAIEALPKGYKVMKNTQSGLPFLVRV